MERCRWPTHKKASRPTGRNILKKLRRLALGETASKRAGRQGCRIARGFRSARRRVESAALHLSFRTVDAAKALQTRPARSIPHHHSPHY